MSTVKPALKAAKAALDVQDYKGAVENAEKVISIDAHNYNAYVFLGLAFDKQDQFEPSEAAYRQAIRIKDRDALAWQGLVTLYEKQKSDKLDAYHHAALKLAEVFMEKDDKHRCQSVLDQYIGDVKKYGSRAQLKHSLEAYLPTGPLYEFLEGRIPDPAHTYSRIADLVEQDEKEKINAEIGQRRTRLGAKIDQVTSDVRREVLGGSQLEGLYNAVIDWTHDDEIRRQYEEKLLQRGYDYLAILPSERKEEKRKHVQKLAEGLVILKHPFLLAWKIKLEWDDCGEIKDIDVGLLREFIEIFPNEGLSKILQGFLGTDLSPFAKLEHSVEVENEEGASPSQLLTDDRLILMTEGITEGPPSMLAHRLMGQYYLHIDEYESAAATAKQGRDHVQAERNISGLALANTLDAINTILGTAFVQYQAPRHHPEAIELFESVLHRKPAERSALLGIGLILEEQEEYAGAIEFLSRAQEESKDPRIRAETAWCRALNGDELAGLHELELTLQDLEGSDTRTRSLRSQILYRIGMCQWNINPSKASRKSRDGPYAKFLAALQADMNFAPAYTSLGIYYADYANDKKRARKCFQKAFELSASEVGAAERLAKSFAKSSEWDLVEVVASRVVQSGRVKPAPGSKKKAVSWPFAALGVVQLNNREYAKGIVSFQSALRTAPADYHCWVGLGESYHHSGRFTAATKAFEQAQRLEEISEDEDVRENWFSKYMLANVKRELGEFDNAISGYQAVLKTRPREFGAAIALLQTLVEGAWHSIELGFYGRAADAARDAINIAQEIVQERSDAFNLWKAIGDACSVFTYVQAYASKLPRHVLKSLLEIDTSLDIFDVLADVDGIGQSTLESLTIDDPNDSFLTISLRAAILAQKRAVHVCANELHAKAVAWFNLGWTEYRAHACESTDNRTGKRKLKHLKASIQCFKHAIEFEAGNAEFWNSLGIVTTELNPRVSQHAFIRSLYLNDKNARVWTNLGTLYLIQEDYELANNAFTCAQSSDPDYAQAWVGQGMLAARLSEADEARKLFTHAFEIADSSSVVIKQQFAMASFDQLLSSPGSASITDAIQPLFALRQLRSQLSSDLVFDHIFSLFAERVGEVTEAIAVLSLVTSSLEGEYETSESPRSLLQFAQAKSDLGRAQLARGLFDSAVENVETALSLCDDEGLEKVPRQMVRLAAHMTAGLAHYYQGSMDQAISMFRNALEETDGDPDIVCLLARMLWAKGGQEEQNVAREQLFDCVENHPSHVDAVTLLGAIALLDEDQDTVEAVIADMRSLRVREDVNAHQQTSIGRLLMSMTTLYRPEVIEDMPESTESTTAVMLAPSKPHGWVQLAELSDEPYPAEIAVLTATKATAPRGDLNATDLSEAYAATRKIEDAQRAIMIAPFENQSWEALDG